MRAIANTLITVCVFTFISRIVKISHTVPPPLNPNPPLLSYEGSLMAHFKSISSFGLSRHFGSKSSILPDLLQLPSRRGLSGRSLPELRFCSIFNRFCTRFHSPEWVGPSVLLLCLEIQESSCSLFLKVRFEKRAFSLRGTARVHTKHSFFRGFNILQLFFRHFMGYLNRFTVSFYVCK